MKTLLITTLALSSSLSFAARCLPDQDGQETFKSRCEVIVIGTRTPECHVNEPWNYPYNTSTRNDNWYHVHGWYQSSPTAKASNCETTYEECKRLAYGKLDKFRDVNMCGYVSVGKAVEWRFQTFSENRNVESEQLGRFKK